MSPTLEKHAFKRRWPLFVACFALVLVGCSFEMKFSIGEGSKDAKPTWQGYATSRSTDQFEFWFLTSNSHSDCISDMRSAITQWPSSQWSKEPVGCRYIGSKNKYVLLLVNKLYNWNAFLCVARFRESGEYSALMKGAERETAGWTCEV